MPSPSRRLTTVWFADIVGFTRLSSADEPLALRAMEAMRECVKVAVGAHHGTVIKFLGDGALAEFPSAEGAVAAALEVGARFKGATSALGSGPYQLHVGIHVGDVTVSSDGDLFGDGVNRAERLQQLAEAGQILVSEDVFRLVRKRPELQFAALGERTAKGLDEPFQVFAVKPKGQMVGRLRLLEKPAAPPQSAQRSTTLARHPRAIGAGIGAGVVAFIALGVWTAVGGTADEDPTPLVTVPVPAQLPLPALDSAFVLASWPPPTPAAAPTQPGDPPDAAGPVVPTTLRGPAALGERYFARLNGRDLSWHEVLPRLRTALNEARDGNPTPARAHAIRGVVLFMAARGPGAEAAFRASLAADPNSGVTRLLYAQFLTAGGRFGEALFQLDQAKGKGVSNAALDGARGAVLFRDSKARDAQQALERSLRSENVLSTRILLARALVAQDKNDEALRVLEPQISSFEVVPWMAYARLHAARGDGGAARPRMLQMAAREDAGYAGAILFLEAGEATRAASALERLARARDPDLIWLGVDPEWASVRDDRQFRRLAARMLSQR